MNNRMKLQHVARVTFPAVFADALPGHVVAALAVPRVAVARVGAAQPEPAHVTRDLEIWQCEEKYLGSTENICPPPRSAGPCIPRRRCRRRTRGDTWRRARSRSGWRSPGPRCRRGTACRSRYRASLDTRVSHVARVVTLIRISNGNENLKNVLFLPRVIHVTWSALAFPRRVLARGPILALAVVLTRSTVLAWK